MFMVKIGPFSFTMWQSHKKLLWSFFSPKHKNKKRAAEDLQSVCGCALWQPYQCQGRKPKRLIIWGYALFTNSVARDFQTIDHSPQHTEKNIFLLCPPFQKLMDQL